MSTDTKDVIDSIANHKVFRVIFWTVIAVLSFTGMINICWWLGKHVTVFVH